MDTEARVLQATVERDVLDQFLDCADPQESEQLLKRVVWEYASPIVRRIVASKVRKPASDDVENDILVDLITRLRDLKQSGERGSIRDFSAYSAVVAYHGCKEYLRRSFPQRHRLRNRLRYLLRKHPSLALRETPDGELVCGPRETAAASDPADKSPWASSRELAQVVERIMEARGPVISFDDLTESVAQQCGIFDQPDTSSAELVQPSASVETVLVQRDWLAQLWNEIGSLPLEQRIALLLSMRDDRGGPALVLLPITGVATLRKIAARMKMPVENLVEIWNELPLDDQRIGQLLGLDSQRVANLRKSARERLRRRTAPQTKKEKG